MAAEELEDGEKHLEAVAAWLADGKTLLSLSEELASADFDISPNQIRQYLYSRYGQQKTQEYLDAARLEGAFARVDDAEKIADGLDVDDVSKTAVAAAKVRIDTKLWAAERFNRGALGSTKNDVNLNLSFGSLHLDALRARAVATPAETGRGLLETDASQTRAFISPGPAPVADVEEIAIEAAIPGGGSSS